MIRAVIDTNVFVSPLISPLGNEAMIVLAIENGIITPCYSAELLKEYVGVLARPKFSFPPERVENLKALLHRRGEFYSPPFLNPTLPDPADDAFLACARAANAAVIVTGNKRHFPRELCSSIDVLSAGQLLDRMTLEF